MGADFVKMGAPFWDVDFGAAFALFFRRRSKSFPSAPGREPGAFYFPFDKIRLIGV